ncbi:peptide ABC transporter substrate-binding protein [Halobacillus litoralis]|uniref:peptide ABC transporter substrate-binding protein n=1 Tax=Halobacillus litoralis TaxID=45668 RepID=UPI001CD22686|nr:peptide ABC transporter substrate-binding protein [Halobacillus litoralis]MCA0969218.1 peptide ABC transporter substrate-binding protein [Halobacillus litoralis]
MKKIVLSLVLLSTAFLAACYGGGSDSSDAKSASSDEMKQELNLVAGAEIPSLDSSLGIDEIASQWLGSTKDGLYRLGPDSTPEPGIAKSHEISEDGLNWTFELREDAVWSNGEPVTAHDFVFAWQRAVDPDTGSEYGPYMMNGVIKNAKEVSEGEMEVDALGVKAVDDYTFAVTLAKPVPYFESMVAFPTFLPMNEAFVTEQGDQYAMEAENILSNGPFKMTEWNQGEGWTVVKNEDYWDADEVQLEQINVKVVKDTAAGVNLYQTDAIDQVGLTSEFVDQYRTSDEFNIEKAPVTFFLKMNQENEVLQNKKARQAIQYIIDRESMVDVILNDGSEAVDGIVPSDFVSHPESGEDFRDLNDGLIEYNPEKAQQLWTEAKQELGIESTELRFLGGDTEVSKNMDAYLKDQLEKLEGLTVKIESVPFKVRLQRDKNMNYDLQNFGWGPDYLDAYSFLNMWMTDGGNNKTGYSSETYDSLINQASGELALKPAERFDTLVEAERLLIEEDAVLAPLYQDGVAQMRKSYLKNVTSNPMGAEYTYKYAYIEK